MILRILKLKVMAECVSPSPSLPHKERGQTIRCASFKFYAALKSVIKKFLP